MPVAHLDGPGGSRVLGAPEAGTCRDLPDPRAEVTVIWRQHVQRLPGTASQRVARVPRGLDFTCGNVQRAVSLICSGWKQAGPVCPVMCGGQSSGQRSWCCLTSRDLISVQFSRSVVSDPLRPHGQQHTRPPCPSPTPGTC